MYITVLCFWMLCELLCSEAVDLFSKHVTRVRREAEGAERKGTAMTLDFLNPLAQHQNRPTLLTRPSHSTSYLSSFCVM